MRFRVPFTAVGILVISFAVFVVKLNSPSTYIVDEKSYIDAARSILRGGTNINPEHPPLAKFFIAEGIKLAGDNPVGWRLASTVFGALALVGIFLWTYVLLEDYALAVATVMLTMFNNFHFVMSRLAMLDVFYFAFVIWGVLAFTAAIRLPLSLIKRRLLMLSSGVLFGLGGACKWTAVVSLAVLGVFAGFFFLRDKYTFRQIGVTVLVFAFVVLPCSIYYFAYWPLFLVTHKPFTVHAFIAMNVYMWQYHVACPGNPALACPWYQWFFRATPVRVMNYMMGNYVVVWGGLGALFLCGLKFLRAPALAEGMVLSLYAANVLQWVVIPQKITVYYYYFPPATFLSLAIVLVCVWLPKPGFARVRPVLIAVVAAGVFFLICYPKMAALHAPYDCALTCWPY